MEGTYWFPNGYGLEICESIREDKIPLYSAVLMYGDQIDHEHDFNALPNHDELTEEQVEALIEKVKGYQPDGRARFLIERAADHESNDCNLNEISDELFSLRFDEGVSPELHARLIAVATDIYNLHQQVVLERRARAAMDEALSEIEELTQKLRDLKPRATMNAVASAIAEHFGAVSA